MAANKYDTTITDKPGFSVISIDIDKISKLSVDEKIIFELLRDSFLEIMPLETGKNNHGEDAVRFSENFAFINLKAFTTGVGKIVDTKLTALETKLNLQITTAMAALTPVAAATTASTTSTKGL